MTVLDPMETGYPWTPPPDDRRCTAHSSQSGERCTKYRTPGTNVCAAHGSKAPQVQAAAKRRLLEAADPAAAVLIRELLSPEASIRIKAATEILDRAGLGRNIQISNADEAVSDEEAIEAARTLVDELAAARARRGAIEVTAVESGGQS